MAAVSTEELESLDALRTQVDALQPQAAEARLQIARGDRSLYDAIRSAAESLRAFDWSGYRDTVATARRAAERHADATQRAFAGIDIPGVLSEAWSEFMLAGEAYLEHLGEGDYPHDDDRCLYCRQPLARQAVELVKKYRDYCNNALRQELNRARAAVQTVAGVLATLDLRALETQLTRRLGTLEGRGEPPAILNDALELVALGLPLHEAVKKGEDVTPGELLPLAEKVGRDARAGLALADQLIATLTAEAAERQRALEEATAKLRELEARVHLRAILPDLEKHVTRLR